MRLPLIAQADLTPEQRPIYEDMRAGIDGSFQGFKSIAENGALLGPRISRDLLMRGMGYRHQEIQHRGLGKATRRKLRRSRRCSGARAG
jgi:hypothetical protein